MAGTRRLRHIHIYDTGDRYGSVYRTDGNKKNVVRCRSLEEREKKELELESIQAMKKKQRIQRH